MTSMNNMAGEPPEAGTSPVEESSHAFLGLEGVTLERHVPCTLRDEVVLRADVYRPADSDLHPVVLMRTPYGKTTAQSDAGYSHPAWFAQHGYIVVIQDCRGCNESEGDFYPFVNEAVDGYEAVEWASDLPGSDGRVAMYGFSYVGATQLLAATLRPRGLVAITPGFAPSRHHEGCFYRGGAFSLALAASWALDLAAEGARRNGDSDAYLALRQAWRRLPCVYDYMPQREQPELARYAPYYLDWLDHPTYDDYWRQFSIDEDYARYEVPALHLGGWWDTFLAGTIANFAGLRHSAANDYARHNQKLVIGPWAHYPWTPIGESECNGRAIDEWQLRWLDYTLKGHETGVMDAPATVWLEGDGWIDLEDWPPPASEIVDWYLHSDGRANSVWGDGSLSLDEPLDEAPDILVTDPRAPTPSRGGHSCCHRDISPIGPAVQNDNEALNAVLVYTSPPLPHDLVLLGDVSAVIYASADVPDIDVVVRLCRVSPDGVSTNLLEGIVRSRYRDSPSDPRLMVPGEVARLDIVLGPLAARIKAGHQLRVDVCGSDFPQWDRNLHTGGDPATESMSAARIATAAIHHNATYPSVVRLPADHSLRRDH